MIYSRAFCRALCYSFIISYSSCAMETKNPAQQKTFLEGKVVASFLGMATYGATDYLLASTQFSAHGEENLNPSLERLIRGCLTTYKVNTNNLHIKKMNRATKQTTLFPGVYVSRYALFIDEDFFSAYCKDNNGGLNSRGKNALWYAVILLQKKYYLKEKISSVSTQLVSSAVASGLTPYLISAISFGCENSGIGLHKVLDGIAPSLIGSSVSYAMQTAFYYLVLEYVSPICLKSRQWYQDYYYPIIDQMVTEKIGKEGSIDLLRTFKYTLGKHDPRWTRLKARIQK
jgi:hypothetical protein